jgi:hypothetical protein
VSHNDPTTKTSPASTDTISVLVADETPRRGYTLTEVVPVILVAFCLALAFLAFLGSAA